MLDVLGFRAKDTPGKIAYTFQNQAVSYLQLWTGINQFANLLLLRGARSGDRILVCLPNGGEFFSAFYGSQLIGCIPVPIFPNSGIERILTIATLCQARYVVVPPTLNGPQLTRIRAIAQSNDLIVLMPGESSGRSKHISPEIDCNQVAFIQYTSGSTGNPKGVMISHRNLMINIQQMILGMEITPAEIFISWLPIYHDMGLILKTMVPFYLGAIVHLLPTNLADVGAWLEAIQKHKGTFTAAPDFAYRLCLRHANSGTYDLSSLRVALNAAEPVRQTTIAKFERKYNLSNVMVAGYGLAEATVGVSMWQPGTRCRVDSHGFVSVGQPFPGVAVAIVDSAGKMDQGQIGEIAIKSEANSLGYYQNPEATAALVWNDHYYLTGDLGYQDQDGYLFIVSRKKNIIKKSGQNLSPHEIEEIVDRSPHIRYSAAIGIDIGGIEGEQVYIFAELRNEDQFDHDSLHLLAVGIISEVHHQMGFRPARVYLLKARSIPLTHNGKIQHPELKQQYLNKEIKLRQNILYPEF